MQGGERWPQGMPDATRLTVSAAWRCAARGHPRAHQLGAGLGLRNDLNDALQPRIGSGQVGVTEHP